MSSLILFRGRQPRNGPSSCDLSPWSTRLKRLTMAGRLRKPEFVTAPAAKRTVAMLSRRFRTTQGHMITVLAEPQSVRLLAVYYADSGRYLPYYAHNEKQAEMPLVRYKPTINNKPVIRLAWLAGLDPTATRSVRHSRFASAHEGVLSRQNQSRGSL